MSTKKEDDKKDDTAIVVDPKLEQFYKSHNVSIRNFDKLEAREGGTRFIRLNPRFDKQETIELLKSELSSTNIHTSSDLSNGESSNQHASMSPVPWLNSIRYGFYTLPNNFSLSKSNCFKSGRIYGMDVSSGACVAALLSDEFDIHNNEQKELASKTDEMTLSLNKSKCDDDDDGISFSSSSSFRVLDLCCAPGLKLCMIADLLSSSSLNLHDPNQQKVVVGVDISTQRIDVCKNIIKKYHINVETSGKEQQVSSVGKAASPYCERTLLNREYEGNDVRIRLYCQDGTKFGTTRHHLSDTSPCHSSSKVDTKLVFDSYVAVEQQEQSKDGKKRKRMNKSARIREMKRLKQVVDIDMISSDNEGISSKATSSSSKGNDAEENVEVHMKLFDRVLVDAECSTDGSLKHVHERIRKQQRQQQRQQTPATIIANNTQLTDSSQLQDLVTLQRNLIESGFRLLKDGGIMVYSTCSLSQEQNECVVTWLLQKYPHDAIIIPLNFDITSSNKREDPSEGVKSNNEMANSMVVEGTIPGTIRFVPSTGFDSSSKDNDSHFFGGGFFLAKIKKKQMSNR